MKTFGFISQTMRRLSCHLRMNAKQRAGSDNRTDPSTDAELRVMRKLERLSEVIEVHHALRIPDPNRKYGAGEVDCLALTERGILLIEVKNWGGRVDLVGDDVSHSRIDAGKPVLPQLSEKSRHLKRCAISMLQDNAIEVETLLVFTNSNARLSKEVMAHNSVATFNTLEEKITAKFQPLERLTDAQITGYKSMISCFGSWDQVVDADTGKNIIGDFRDSELPFGWSRSEIKTVSFSFEQGLWKTITRGPHLKAVVERWSGLKEALSVPLDSLVHTAPWGAGGVDGNGNYPLEKLSQISFGFQFPPFHDEHLKLLPSTSQLPVKHPQSSPGIDYRQRFAKGSLHKGTVSKVLCDNQQQPYALLVALIERKVTGRIKISEFDHVNPEVFKVFYGTGKPIDVRIEHYAGPRSIRLTLR